MGLALGAFLVHELVDWLIGRRTLENYAHHQEQCLTQNGRPTLGDAAVTDIHPPRLIRLGVNTSESHQSLLGVKSAHIADFRHGLGVEDRANSKYLHHHGVLREGSGQGLHLISERHQGRRYGLKLGYSLLYQELGYLDLLTKSIFSSRKAATAKKKTLRGVIRGALSSF